MKSKVTALLGLLFCAILSFPAFAEGIAADSKELGGLTDGQCLDRAEEMIAVEKASSPTFERVLRGDYVRRIVYSDGSVDFMCLRDRVVITVYFSNAGDGFAGADLKTFLDAF